MGVCQASIYFMFSRQQLVQRGLITDYLFPDICKYRFHPAC